LKLPQAGSGGLSKESHLHNIKREGDTVSPYAEPMANYPDDLVEITIEDDYTKQKIFSVSESSFC
jgi:hypothetical protein